MSKINFARIKKKICVNREGSFRCDCQIGYDSVSISTFSEKVERLALVPSVWIYHNSSQLTDRTLAN